MPEIGGIGGSSTVQEKMSFEDGDAADVGKELGDGTELCISPIIVSLLRCTCLRFWFGLATQTRQST